jgi:hypothetical protein
LRHDTDVGAQFENDVVRAGVDTKITPRAGLQKRWFSQGERGADPANVNILLFDSRDLDHDFRSLAGPEPQEFPSFQDGVSLP